MNIPSPVIRPPSEADSLLVQVTSGCSYNRCTFCPAYKEITFQIVDKSLISQQLRSFSASGGKKVFLCDGDALIAPQHLLEDVLVEIRNVLPGFTRVSSYANAKSIASKSTDELKVLADLGLKILHIGLESGSDSVLENLEKWGTAQQIVEQAQRVRSIGMRLFATVLLGAGGRNLSAEHACETGLALSRMDPHFVGALTLMPCRGTKLYSQVESGSFVLPSPKEMIYELRAMLENTNLSSGIFYANHASNYLPLQIRMPREKEKALAYIDNVLLKDGPLKPEWMRGL